MRKHGLRDPLNINLPLITKANEMHYFSNLFWKRALHVLGRSAVHHQGVSALYTQQ